MDSTELYRDITAFARTTPSWVRHLAEVWTEAGILLFGALFVVAWWRARSGDARTAALAVLAPLATAVAHVASELLKTVVDEERPCRAVANAVASLVPCPPAGDWSFPSNHATIAGAAAVGLAVARRRLVFIFLTAPMALLLAFSRVFVGVHYPHDVVAGLLLGAAVAAVALRALVRLVQTLVTTVRTSRLALAAWFVGPGPGSGPGSGPGPGLRP